jgi:hypothetical protein
MKTNLHVFLRWIWLANYVFFIYFLVW